jgi:hypothetical protein
MGPEGARFLPSTKVQRVMGEGKVWRWDFREGLPEAERPSMVAPQKKRAGAGNMMKSSFFTAAYVCCKTLRDF